MKELYKRIGNKLYRLEPELKGLSDQLNKNGQPIPDGTNSHFIVDEDERFVYCALYPNATFSTVTFSKDIIV